MAIHAARIGRNLSQVIENASASYARMFLASCKKPDESLLEPPNAPTDAANGNESAVLKEFLSEQDQEVVAELDRICASVLELAQGKGATSLETVAGEKLYNVEYERFINAPDALCRSIHAHCEFPAVFRDAESFYAARRYREHRKLYAAFEIDDESVLKIGEFEPDTAKLCQKLEEVLELRAKATVSVLQLPATPDYPPSLLVAFRHPGALSSILDHRADGDLNTYYYRPSREAVLIYTPGHKKIEVCADSFDVRALVADTFAEVVLAQDLSAKPLTRRDFNLERFRKSFDLDHPDLDAAEITSAVVVEAEMPLGHWGRRLNLKVTKDEDIEEAANDYLRSAKTLVRKFGFTKIVIAVEFVRRVDARKATLRLQVSGGNTSNVQAQQDPFLRDLGFQLLAHWGLMSKVRSITEREVAEWFQMLLSLYDLPGDEVSAQFFEAAGVDPWTLFETGFLEKKPRQVLVLIEDEDGNSSEGELSTGPESGSLRLQEGFGESERVIDGGAALMFKIERRWLGEKILKTLGGALGAQDLQIEEDNLASLGYIDLQGQKVPFYLARGLGDTKVVDKLDIALRQRHKSGVGVVLALSEEAPHYLGPNVVVNIRNLMHSDATGIEVSEQELRRQFDNGRTLVASAQVAQVLRKSTYTGSLILPGRDPLALTTAKQIAIFERLVTAARDGSGELLTKELMAGMDSDNPKQLFTKKKWQEVYGTYLRHGSSNRFWRLATGVRDLLSEVPG